MADANKIALAGSERAVLEGATLVGPTDPAQLVELSIVLKRPRPLPEVGVTLTHDEYAEAHSAHPDHLDQVKAFAAEHGLEIVDQDQEAVRRTVKVRGTVAQLETAFGVTLNDYDHPDSGTYRGRVGAIHVPPELSAIVEGIFGLDNRPQAKPHFRIRPPHQFASRAAGHQALASFSPVQVAQLYNFPSGVNGSGQTIGILELGGGFQQSDITNYFGSLSIQPPNVIAVSVDNGSNSPSTPDSADGEVLLDIEVAGAVAPGATIVVYFAPNTDQGFQDALSTAIHDTTNNPSVVSISWGGPESSWTAQAMQSMDQIAQEAAALGVTITVASGDNGSSDGATDGSNNVDFPASSPNVLACGGTSLIATNSVPPAMAGESVWNDGAQGGAGGGGFSVQFPQPSYQSVLANSYPGQAGRGVPDVSGDADPQTGYNVLVDGQQAVVGGTSAVAPLWAGLIALLNQQLGARVGFLNPQLYQLPAPNNGFHDITQGNNGAYSAGPGWDPCTGLGSPIGTTLATLLTPPPPTNS